MNDTVRPDERVGAQLAAAREARGLSLDDIAERTRVPKRSLALIEAGSSEGLPALTYTAGFVRSYAAALGLDGQALAQAFRAEMGGAVRRHVAEPYAPADPARVPTRLLAIVALLLALLVASGYAVWRGDGLFGGGSEDRERLAAGTDPALYPSAEAVPPPTPLGGPSATPLVPSAAAAGAAVTVTAREQVWLRIGERSGATLFVGTMTPGQTIAIPATASDPVLRTGRPEAIDVKVGDAVVPTLGPPDTLVRDASLKPAALLGRSPPAPAPLVPAAATP